MLHTAGKRAMKETIEQILHQEVEEHPFAQEEKLPLACRGAFDFKQIEINRQPFLLAEPVDSMNLTELRKSRSQLERAAGCPCAFYLKTVNQYAAAKMLEEGIPFIRENRQVYLPFLGMLIADKAERDPKPAAELSFLTQKLLLKALYETWNGVTAAEAARLLGVSRMSGTRCFDEIESLGLPFLRTEGKSRRFDAMPDRKQMWETLRPVLRNPVIRAFRSDELIPGEFVLSGLTALAAYSMLNEDRCKYYAVPKGALRHLDLGTVNEVPPEEEAACVIQEVGYILPFGDGTAIDPLSIAMMLSAKELEDPRVETAVNKMLEELVW
jgi:hypothetical protein